jgi:hypothetical protein
MYVSYNPVAKKYFLKAAGWIERPDGYNSCDLEGTITGNVFSGSICSGYKFHVVKKQ